MTSIAERSSFIHDLANMVESSNKVEDNRALEAVGRAWLGSH
jgi:hypothetical protein